MSFAGRLTLSHPWFVALVVVGTAGALIYMRKQASAGIDPNAMTAADIAKNEALITKINAGVASWADTEHNLIQSGASLYEPLFMPDNTATLQQPAPYDPSLLDQLLGD